MAENNKISWEEPIDVLSALTLLWMSKHDDSNNLAELKNNFYNIRKELKKYDFYINKEIKS